MSRKLSHPMQMLLDEIRRNGQMRGGGLYVKRYGRYWRTIEALEKRGLVRCDEPDFSRNGQDHWVAT